MGTELIFRQLYDAASSTYTYLLADARTREAVLIDTVYEQHLRDKALLDELGLALEAERRKELLVALADPDHAAALVDHQHAFGRVGEQLEHRAGRQLEHAARIARQVVGANEGIE